MLSALSYLKTNSLISPQIPSVGLPVPPSYKGVLFLHPQGLGAFLNALPINIGKFEFHPASGLLVTEPDFPEFWKT